MLLSFLFGFQYTNVSPVNVLCLNTSYLTTMPKIKFRITTGNREQRLRRRLNAAQDQAALYRLELAMTRPEALQRAQQQINQTAQLEPRDDTFEPDDNSYNPNPGFEYDDEDGEGGGDLTWVTLSDDPTWVTLSDDPTWGTSCVQEPDPIDILVAASNERYVQQAREFNWRVLLNHLHPVYMTQKLVTNNWAKSNSYDDFNETCSCVKTYRTVDLVDIYGM
jgi:hypothetical protein